MLPLGAVQPPAWIMSGAAFDFDFVNQRYWGGNVNMAQVLGSGGRIKTIISGPSNGETALVPNAAGILITIPTYTPRISPGVGMWCSRNSTNNALWCRDLTNAAWVKTTMTTALNQVGANNGSNSATLLTATAGLATVLQTIVLASANTVSSAWVKRVTGSGTVEMTQDGVTWTDITSQLVTTAFTWVSVPNATVVNPVIGFRLTTNTDAITVDYVQCEPGTYKSLPIPTTTAAVNRTTEEPSISDPSGAFQSDGYRLLKTVFVSGSPWAVYAEYTGNPENTGWLISSDGPPSMGGGCSGGTFSFQGATSGSNGTQGLGNINKVMGRLNGFGSICCINGGALGSYLSSGNALPKGPATALTHCGILNNGADTSFKSLNGYIRRLAIWVSSVPSDAEMVNYTIL